MTLQELSQLYYLKNEIANDERRLALIRTKANSPSSPNLSGSSRTTVWGSRIEYYVAEIDELEDLIKQKKEKCIKEQIKLEKWINEIPDSLVRLVYTARFVENKEWSSVANAVGGYNTSDSVKKICYRYLKKYNKEHPTQK